MVEAPYPGHCAYTKVLIQMWKKCQSKMINDIRNAAKQNTANVSIMFLDHCFWYQWESFSRVGRTECRTKHICPAPGSTRKRYLNNSKQASLGISISNGYSSIVLCTDKLATCLRAVRMQHLLAYAASETHVRSHYVVPWRLIARASLNSRSKSNSCIPK